MIKSFRLSQTEEQTSVDAETLEVKGCEIVLHNDDYNTFDHVIAMLVRYCEHTEEQAHQCALIVHFKGKCSVKKGDYDDLRPRCEALLQAGLTATIEEF
jgi:ATP-dependent Clp protease adaptor protein ClpS